MTDKIMATIALTTMVVFLATVAWHVPDIDLIIVIMLVSAMAVYDFWRSFHARRQNPSSEDENSDPGKPA